MNMKYIKHVIGTITFLFGLLIIPATTFADPNANGTPPVENNFTGDFAANFGGWGCSFPFNITWQGKAKTITLPGNRQVLTSPGLQAVITNLNDTTKTVDLNITGAFHTTTNGTIVTTVYTGRNLIGDPSVGLILAVGNFSWAWDSSTSPSTLVQPLLGNGKQIDVCALIS